MDYPKDYFDINKKIMKIASLWHSEDTTIKYKVFSIFCFVYCIIFCTPSEFIKLIDTWGNMTEFMMNFGIALTHGIASLKVLNWYIRKRQILKIIEILNDEKYYYKATEEFQPGFIIERAKKINVTISKMFFILANLIPGSSYIFALYKFIFHNSEFYGIDKNNQMVYCYKLPFYSWIPFEYTDSKVMCFIAIIFQSFPFTYLTIMIVAMDTLYMGLINYITAHLLVLQEAFRNIRSSAIAQITNSDVDHEMMKQMKKCTIHFQTVQRLWDYMENVYSLQTLGQVLVSLFVLCTCLFLISTEPMTSNTFFIEVMYVIAIIYQLTLYCWFGNELTLAGLGISRSIYESDWLSADSKFKKSMLITMLRLERPLALTIGKFSPLTLNTLVNILRGSYSLYAVLKKKNSLQDK